MEQEVVITYETLFEILRREKSREELQKLPDNFIEEVKKYLNDKKQTTLSKNDDPFSEIEQEKTQRQISNLKKMLRELYERREKKIITMSLNKSRISNSVMETNVLLPEEKNLFEQLICVFDNARNEILLNLINAEQIKEKEIQEKKIEPAAEQPQAAAAEEPRQKQDFQQAYDLKTVKFVTDTNQFVGPNLEIYGPFSKEDTANLPLEVCNVLVNKNKAVFCSNDE